MKNCIFKIFLHYKTEKNPFDQQLYNEVKKKLEKKVAPEYMPMFTEIDYFLKN